MRSNIAMQEHVLVHSLLRRPHEGEGEFRGFLVSTDEDDLARLRGVLCEEDGESAADSSCSWRGEARLARRELFEGGRAPPTKTAAP